MQPLKNRYFFLDFFRGTFPPARRASDRPIAIACFRLVTFLPDRPLFKVPFFRSCIAFLTFADALAPYLAIKFLLSNLANPAVAEALELFAFVPCL